MKRDCNSRRVAVRFLLKTLSVFPRRRSLSSGSLISNLMESISKPMNVNVVHGETVFSDLIGRLMSFARVWNAMSAS